MTTRSALGRMATACVAASLRQPACSAIVSGCLLSMVLSRRILQTLRQLRYPVTYVRAGALAVRALLSSPTCQRQHAEVGD